ncbi:hypothetical protein P3S68_026793 [Capsicum galapagoense]
MSAPVSPNPGKALLTDRNGGDSLKAGLQKVKFWKALSFRRHKKAYHAEEGSSSDRRNSKLFSYEAPVYADHAGGSFCSNTSGSSSDEDLVHYSHHISDTKHKYPEDKTAANQSAEQSSKCSLLSWRKRKLSFKYPKTKGEPLLKKHYGEDGADDIDFDRRQLCSSNESSSRGHKSEETSSISVSKFGDESFAVGSWELKEIISRDGQMKLQTLIFFALIDQQSERATGESACTNLVAVIADWFHCNPEDIPIKSQLDSLICEGSMQWRDLCENETYRERFPDKHFDLVTVLEAKEGFHFLHGSMSFDNIWDEISKSAQETPHHGISCVYIMLFEGCNQAYILKFDQDTTIMQAPSESQQPDDKPSCDRKEKTNVKEAADESKIFMSTNSDDNMQEDRVPEKNIIYIGKEACKEDIKSFLAAIPIRELQVDVKKGLMASTLLHQRLQIEFHYTMIFVPKFEESSSEELIANSLAKVPSAAAE